MKKSIILYAWLLLGLGSIASCQGVPEHVRSESPVSRHDSAGWFDPASIPLPFALPGGELTEQHFLADRTAEVYHLPMSASSPEAVMAYRQALAYAANDETEAYFAQMEAATAHDPQLFMGYAHCAMVMLFEANPQEATPLLAQALAIPLSKLSPAERILRPLLRQWQQTPQASPASVMAELVEAFPETAEAYVLAGSCAYWLEEDMAKAVHYLEQAQQLRPTYGPGYNLLGHSYLALGQMEQARIAFEAYLIFAHEEANAYDCLGDYYLQTKHYALAARYYDQAAFRGMRPAQQRAEQARHLLAQSGQGH